MSIVVISRYLTRKGCKGNQELYQEYFSSCQMIAKFQEHRLHRRLLTQTFFQQKTNAEVEDSKPLLQLLIGRDGEKC
jgi:hypothetical protein